MNISEILELTRAGWTKAEILQIAAQKQTAVQEEAPKVQEEPTKVQEEPTKVQEEANTQQPDFAAILTELGAIKASIHAGNVAQLQQPNQPAPETADQILAKLLVPGNK